MRARPHASSKRARFSLQGISGLPRLSGTKTANYSSLSLTRPRDGSLAASLPSPMSYGGAPSRPVSCLPEARLQSQVPESGTDLVVSEIACRLGFADLANFTVHFAERMAGAVERTH
ncbi:protein of unknown function (plasmid) [Caballeronia sp. S22]